MKTQFIHLTDTYASDLASKTLFDYDDHANFYAYGYVSWNIPKSIREQKYIEIGEHGDWVSSIVAVGEETICFCLLNAMTGEPVRQFVIPFVLFEKMILLDGNIENTIKIRFNEIDTIIVRLPRNANGTSLKHQNGMRLKIMDTLETMNRRRNRAAYESR